MDVVQAYVSCRVVAFPCEINVAAMQLHMGGGLVFAGNQNPGDTTHIWVPVVPTAMDEIEQKYATQMALLREAYAPENVITGLAF